MKDSIAEYQRWKQQGEALRAEAMSQLEYRYSELLTEAAQIAEEYRFDFGVGLKPPPGVTQFEYKVSNTKRTKPVPAAPSSSAVPPPTKKRMTAAPKKPDSANVGGPSVKDLNDNGLWSEDELRRV